LFADPKHRKVLLSLSLVLLTVLVYYPIRENSFINFDDSSYITRNPQVTSGLRWSTIPWAFTSFDAGNWHPLTWLSHALDYQLFGLNPAGHHFVNVVLDAINAALLFWVLESLTCAPWRSLMVAALFAVHPLNVESVAWAAERKNTLSMLFFLLTVWAYMRYVRRPGGARYAVVAGLLALGLMSKPQIITLPLVLLLLDYWPLGRFRVGPIPNRGHSAVPLFAEKIPLLLLSGLSALVTLLAQGSAHAVHTSRELPLSIRLENAAISYARYLGHIFVPLDLAPLYPYPLGHLEIFRVAAASASLLAITALVIWQRQHQFLLVGWLWFLGTLVPMIGLVQVGEQAMADRYLYLPMIGIFIMAVWGGAEVFRGTQGRSTLAFLCAVPLVAFSLITHRQIGFWKDSQTLWSYTLRVTSGNYMAEDNLAQALATQGRVDEALHHFHAAEDLHDYAPGQILALGVYEQRNGHARDAISQYTRVLERATDSKIRSAAFANAGFSYLDLKDSTAAKQSFESALKLDANNAAALLGSGLIAHKSGNLDLAVERYTTALSINPDDFAYVLLARALEQKGDHSDANSAYQHAEQLSNNLAATRSLVDRMLTP
jgi:tetratricopeptide (TPR) repeat protein